MRCICFTLSHYTLFTASARCLCTISVYTKLVQIFIICENYSGEHASQTKTETNKLDFKGFEFKFEVVALEFVGVYQAVGV